MTSTTTPTSLADVILAVTQAQVAVNTAATALNVDRTLAMEASNEHEYAERMRDLFEFEPFIPRETMSSLLPIMDHVSRLPLQAAWFKGVAWDKTASTRRLLAFILEMIQHQASGVPYLTEIGLIEAAWWCASSVIYLANRYCTIYLAYLQLGSEYARA